MQSYRNTTLGALFAFALCVSAARGGDMADRIMAAAIELNAVPAQYEEVRRVGQGKANPSCAECGSLYKAMVDEWNAFDKKTEQETSTLDQRARGQRDYLDFYSAKAKAASDMVGRFAQQVNSSGPNGSLCGRCSFAGGGQTAPATASVPMPREDVIEKYKEIFWETNKESERHGFAGDTLVGKALRPFHRQSEASHKQESDKFLRQTFALLGDSEARQLLNEELRESWERLGSSRKFEERYGAFMDNY